MAGNILAGEHFKSPEQKMAQENFPYDAEWMQEVMGVMDEMDFQEEEKRHDRTYEKMRRLNASRGEWHVDYTDPWYDLTEMVEDYSEQQGLGVSPGSIHYQDEQEMLDEAVAFAEKLRKTKPMLEAIGGLLQYPTKGLKQKWLWLNRTKSVVYSIEQPKKEWLWYQ